MEITLSLNHENELIQACVKGESWAQRKIYEDFYHQMLGVCMRYAKSEEEAMDILHEGFLKVFQKISLYEPGTSLGAWIKRIMVNTSIDLYRRESRRRTEDIDQAYTLSSSNPSAVSQMSTEEILEAVQKLSPMYRTVFNLYIIDGYSHKEIGEILNITESTSRSNLVKARTKLKSLLNGIEDTDE